MGAGSALKFIPGVGNVVAGGMAVGDLAKGKYASATLDAAGMIPGVGLLADAASIAGAGEKADKALQTGKVVASSVKSSHFPFAHGIEKAAEKSLASGKNKAKIAGGVAEMYNKKGMKQTSGSLLDDLIGLVDSQTSPEKASSLEKGTGLYF